MTTVVNGTTPTSNSDSNGVLLGIILIIGLIVVFFYFGVPAMGRIQPTQNNTAAPETNMPGKIDVNVDQQK